MNGLNIVEYEGPTAAENNLEQEGTVLPKEESTDLVEIVPSSAALVFIDGGLDPFIEKVKERVRSEVYDVSTEKGRQRIASVARSVGVAKESLKRMALELTEDWRTKTAAVNAEKARMIREMDSLRDEIKEPLEKYRQREKERVDSHEQALSGLQKQEVFDGTDPSSDQILARIKEVEGFVRDWEEFDFRAASTKETVIKSLRQKHEARFKYEQDQAELQRLRQEKEAEESFNRMWNDAHEENERIDRAAAESAARAKAQAQAEAMIEIVWAEAQAENAEFDRLLSEKRTRAALEAAEKAKRDAEAAAQKERERIEAEKKAEREAAAQREADTVHQAKINGAAAEAIKSVLESCMFKDGESDLVASARKIVIAIAKGQIPHVKISY